MKLHLHLLNVCLLLNILVMFKANAQTNKAPLRLAVAGITHGHVPWILGRKGKDDVTLVGIYEPNRELASRYSKKYNLDSGLFFTDLSRMLDVVKPEAVVAFGSIYEHMAVVEACAPRRIHVMVEKPLATNTAHANRMEQLARKFNITCSLIMKHPGIPVRRKHTSW